MSINTVAAFEIDEFEQEHIRRVDALRGTLREHLAACIHSMQNAVSTLERLRANDVYDVEFAEGRDGDDIAAFLNDSTRYIRAAYAVVHTVIDKEIQ